MEKKRIIFQCEYCGKEKEQKLYDYNKSKHHYCSRECKNAAMNKKISVICDNCGKEIAQKYSQYNRADHHYCSQKCQKEFQHKMAFEDRECLICHSIFNVSKKSTQSLCSAKCQKIWQTQQTGVLNPRFLSKKSKCDYCGTEIYVKPHKIKNNSYNFCSAKCRQEWYRNIWSQSDEWKEESRQRATRLIADGAFNHTDTKPQIIINELLDKLNIKNQNEYNCKYYAIDNYLIDNNLMIEVMGDYWHGNPHKYTEENINDIQKRRIYKDKAKHTYILNNYRIEILYLWEYDIYNNINLCEKLIKLYIERNGLLQNYHSFNYCLNDNDICLNNDIINALFDKCA